MFLGPTVVTKNTSVEIGVCFCRLRRTRAWAGCWTQGKTQQGKGRSEEVGKVVPQESHNSLWPSPSGTNREVWTDPWLKSHERGLMTTRISDLRLLPERGEREKEREILCRCGSKLTLYFSFSFSPSLSHFIPTTGLPTRWQQQGPQGLRMEAKGDIWGTQAGICSLILVRLLCCMREYALASWRTRQK